MTLSNSPYVAWLQRQGVPLYENQSHYWRRYDRALIPATVAPTFLTLDQQQCKKLLRESRAWLLRYSSDPSQNGTPWWYIVCDSFDPKKLSPKIRQNLNRAGRQCSVRKITADWLADKGYSSYRAAYGRYANARPTTEAQFRKAILATVDGPFEHWGVFVESKLVGYCQCIVEGRHVNTSVTKYDPACLKLRTAYALVSEMVNYYVVQLGMIINNGNRQLVHDTNYQEFLLNLGFQKQFCRLNVIYPGWLKVAIQLTFPVRQIIDKFPNRRGVHRLRALLFQEGLRRRCH